MKALFSSEQRVIHNMSRHQILLQSGLLVVLLVSIYVYYIACVVRPNSHAGLKTESESYGAHICIPQGRPSPNQVEQGRLALVRWKTAKRQERNFLADKIVIGEVLLGLSTKELVECLGPPNFSSREYSWTITNSESSCSLNVEQSNNKVSRAYLVVSE